MLLPVLKLVTWLQRIFEMVSGYQVYRNYNGWGDDLYVKNTTVLQIERDIRKIFEEPFVDANVSKHELHAQCLRWLVWYSEDARNNRDEDVPEIVHELTQMGFLNSNGEVRSPELAAIARDMIRLSYKGMSIAPRLQKKPTYI